MTIALVNTSARAVFGSGNHVDPTLAGVVLGNTLIAVICLEDFNGVQPNLSNAQFTLATRSAGGTSNRMNTEIWYRHNAPAGTNTPAFASADTADNYGYARMFEVSGLAQVAPTIVLNPTGNSNAPATGSTGALSGANNFVVAAVTGPQISPTASQGYVTPSGFTNVDVQQSTTGGDGVMFSMDRVITAATTALSPAWGTTAVNERWTTALAVFAEAVVTARNLLLLGVG